MHLEKVLKFKGLREEDSLNLRDRKLVIVCRMQCIALDRV